MKMLDTIFTGVIWSLHGMTSALSGVWYSGIKLQMHNMMAHILTDTSQTAPFLPSSRQHRRQNFEIAFFLGGTTKICAWVSLSAEKCQNAEKYEVTRVRNLVHPRRLSWQTTDRTSFSWNLVVWPKHIHSTSYLYSKSDYHKGFFSVSMCAPRTLQLTMCESKWDFMWRLLTIYQ